MRKKLAIKGHPTRGKEVIELLEMMGGNTFNSLMENTYPNRVYYIGNNNAITWTNIYSDNGCLDTEDFFTLEEFLGKYPYKVGDKVYIYVQNDNIDGRYDVEVAEITSMRWNPACCKIAYKMKNINREFYKEEIKCKVDDNHTKPSKMKNAIAEFLEHIKNTSKKELEKEFNEFEEWTNVGLTVEEFMDFCNKINKKTIYPKTYVKCCEVIANSKSYAMNEHYINVNKLSQTLQILIICRDAYWEIAGEEMGLGKPWEPNWDDENEYKYGLFRLRNIIYKDSTSIIPTLLIFPTIEMRDAFYDNFKDLIENCKELL